MTELEILEKYEPVLRFAKSERFFPMAVEPYLEQCLIFPSGPHGVVEALLHLNEPLVARIGKLKSEQFFLRFINKPLNDSDVWVWWALLSAAGMVGGWFAANFAGIEAVLALSLLGALVIFMLASPIRLRIIPAALAVLFFVDGASIWQEAFYGWQISAADRIVQGSRKDRSRRADDNCQCKQGKFMIQRILRMVVLARARRLRQRNSPVVRRAERRKDLAFAAAVRRALPVTRFSGGLEPG